MTLREALTEIMDEHLVRAMGGDRLSRETAMLLDLVRSGRSLDCELDEPPATN